VIVPDSSLILYAYNSTSREHESAKCWWEDLLSGPEPVGLVYPVVFSFLRVSTNSRAFSAPLSLSRAAELIETWLNRKNVRLLAEGPNHISDVVAVLSTAGSSGGNLVVDAQIAAIAMAHRATVHTADRDFMRFRDVDCYFPLDKPTRK
jgi:uncharacterized protein